MKRITADLPEVVVERDGFGHSVLRVRKRSFVFIGAQDDVVYVSIKADLMTQDALIKRGPWTRTPYIGQHGWVSFASTDEPDWEEVEELVREAYSKVCTTTRDRTEETAFDRLNVCTGSTLTHELRAAARVSVQFQVAPSACSSRSRS